jgi:Flp pilus assembly protein TadG
VHAVGIDAVTDGRDERGVVLILVALLLTLLCVVAAIVIDVGNVSQERRQAQNAADAAALAGANDIQNGDTSNTGVVSVIKNYVASNYGTVTWTGCTDRSPLAVQPDATTGCISWDANPPSTTKVRVVMPTRNVATSFGRAIGINSFSVSASATATVGAGTQTVPTPCALCTLNTSYLQNGNIGVTGGPVYVDGDIVCQPGGTITTHPSNPQPPIDVTGTAGGQCYPSGFAPVATEGAPVLPDPLASLPAAPDYSGLSAKPDCNSGTASPGIYNNIGGTCTMDPGLYVVTGTFGGNGSGTSVVAHGVTVFFTCGTAAAPRACGSGVAGGTVTLGGSSNMDVTACTASPCSSGAVEGMVLWYDRNNAAVFTLHGTGNIGFVGTVYGKSVTLDVKGTPAGGTASCLAGDLCSEVVVSSVNFSGQGGVNVTYTQSQNVGITVAATVPQLIS